MSNTRHIDLAKLAGQLRGQLPADIRPTPQTARRPATSFPRIPFERFEELLLDAEITAADDAGQLRLRALLDVPAGTAVHYQGRPR